MSKLTTNIELTLPEKSEAYDIGIVNTNSEKIDDTLGKKADLDQNGKVLTEQLPHELSPLKLDLLWSGT